MEKQHSSGDNTKNPLVKILWTGGYDSSYRMLQLSKYEVTIQPYYLSDRLRRSEQHELNAIAAITSDIEKHQETKCTIKFKVADLNPDRELEEAYKRLCKLKQIGPQYVWLCKFAETNPGLELCIENALVGRAHDCLTMYGVLNKIKDGDINYFILDQEKSNIDLVRIFGSFHFPLPLFEITKLETLEEYKKLGFGETMQKTWFCHTPVNNEPCGVCNPCKSVVEEGLAFRLSPDGIKRHKIEMEFGKYKWFGYLKKLRLRIAGY